jgi:hypothetical protein
MIVSIELDRRRAQRYSGNWDQGQRGVPFFWVYPGFRHFFGSFAVPSTPSCLFDLCLGLYVHMRPEQMLSAPQFATDIYIAIMPINQKTTPHLRPSKFPPLMPPLCLQRRSH